MAERRKKKVETDNRTKKQKQEEKEAEERQKKLDAQNAKAQSALYEFGDDIMEGFAEIYRVTTTGIESTAMCVKSTVYPVKQWMMGVSQGSTQSGAAPHQDEMHGEQTFDMM